MNRTTALALLSLALAGCASAPLRDPSLSAEADRSEQRAVAAQKDGMREVAQVQDARADQLRARARNYSLGDLIADVLFNLAIDSATPSPKKR
ncbi:hypothetical protein DBR42_02120 [Pelomonas sp. HMWF004]|nr:hypothetical protein DBR42_02120 [Pelomonas sp. HMWF004]